MLIFVPDISSEPAVVTTENDEAPVSTEEESESEELATETTVTAPVEESTEGKFASSCSRIRS